MKKLISFILVSVLLSSSASALTVSEFVERYNANIGQGSPIGTREEFIIDDTWFLSGYEERNMVIAVIDPGSSSDPLNYSVRSVALKHKPRCQTSVFLANISAAVAAAWPEIPEEERLAEIFRALRQPEYSFGYSYFPEGPVPYNTARMGQFVYQEETGYYTFLFQVPEDQP